MENSVPDVFLPVKDYIVQLEDFDLVKIIGRGSYGEVYYAIHKMTGTKTALKKLLFEELDEMQLEYFIREVLILAYYNNFFLVSFLGFSPTNPYLIVTEFVPCGSLYEALRNKPGCPVLSGTDKTKIAIGIIEGMICLHTNKIIHRDLKSLNILLDEHKLPKICDFGISRAIDEENQAKMTLRIGTFHWMAPEMLDSDDYSYKVDVYAFSIILWEMITGKIPYQGQDPLKILINVKNNGMRPSIPTNCNDDLIKLMVRCWDQDPDNRPTFCELYTIFRDENVHFDDTNTEEIRQFFEQFSVSDEILHPTTKPPVNETAASTAASEKIEIVETTNNEGLNKEETNNEAIMNEDINNEIDINGMNDDVNNDIDAIPVSQVNIQPEQNLSRSEEVLAPVIKNENKQLSDHSMTQQRKTQINLVNYDLQRVNTTKNFDYSSNDSLKEKDKEKDKKKDKKKDKEKEKSKSKAEKEKKKEEKKKKKSDVDTASSNLRRLNSEATFGKKLKDEYPEAKHYEPPKQIQKKPVLPNKTQKANVSFDKIYDMELKEMKKRNMHLNAWNLVNNTIDHKKQQLNNNVFTDYVNNIKDEEQKIPYFIPLRDFKKSKDKIYTLEKNNIFLSPKRFPDNNDTKSFIIDDDVFKDFVKSPVKRSSKLSVTSSTFSTTEEEEGSEEGKVGNMLRKTGGSGKLVNIFKAELDEMTIDNSMEVFKDLQNILQQNLKINADKKKNDVYIFHLANAFKNKGELINQFNNFNGFNILPISGNPLITSSFITLFSVCILYDMKRFPFKVFSDVFNADSHRNTRKFILILQALDTVIQDNIFSNVKERQMLIDVSAKILNHFFDNKQFFNEFNEFSQTLFSMYSKLITMKNVFNENFLLSFRYHLIDTSSIIISKSTNLNCVKTAYSILLSKQVDAIQLFESQPVKKFKLPLRSIISHLVSRHKQSTPGAFCSFKRGDLVLQVASLFARFQKPPISATLVTRLSEEALWCSNTNCDSSASKAACLTLCRIAKTRKGALLLAENSASWMGQSVQQSDQNNLRLSEIKERMKNSEESSEVTNDLNNELQAVHYVAERSSLCASILMVIFASHVSVIDTLSKQPLLWRFLESLIRSSHLQSLYNFNSVDVNAAASSLQCFKSLIESLEVVLKVVRRIKTNLISASNLNDSKILKTLCTKTMNKKTVERAPKTAELSLQIIDILVRAVACSNVENGTNDRDLDFVDDFVNRIPSLLVIGGVVSHKAIIASITVLVLQQNRAKIALKNNLNIRSIKSRSAVNFMDDDDDDAEKSQAVIVIIRQILPKLELIDGFDKYRNELIEILDKNV